MTLSEEDFIAALTRGRHVDFALSCLAEDQLQEFLAANQSVSEPLDANLYRFGDWLIPDNYRNLDLLAWLQERCSSSEELERVDLEWQLYEQKGLIPVLRAVKYIVDTMRANNLVWGVGRGSSVASFILYLLGAHKINSIQWDLDPTEFLR